MVGKSALNPQHGFSVAVDSNLKYKDFPPRNPQIDKLRTTHFSPMTFDDKGKGKGHAKVQQTEPSQRPANPRARNEHTNYWRQGKSSKSRPRRDYAQGESPMGVEMEWRQGYNGEVDRGGSNTVK
jgi:hypothetical protein